MKTPIAFQLLRILSPAELNQLELFLSSPAFNRRPEMARLLAWWRENRHETLDKEKVFRQVEPGKTYLSRDWYLLLSRFAKLVEGFIVWQELQEDGLDKYPFLLRSLRRRRKARLFRRSMAQARALLDNHGQHTAHLLYQAYDLEQEYYDYIASHNRQAPTNLQAMNDRLDEFFIAEKLKQACLAHSRRIASQEAYDIHFLEAVEQQLQSRPALLAVPAIQVYHACYRAVVRGGDKRAFQNLRQAMAAHRQGFPKQEIRDLYLLAINYCIRALNRGAEGFALEAFTLYEQSLEQGYLMEDGHIPESTFGNIVSLGLKLQRFDWVEQFIRERARFLRPEFQESLPSYAAAKLAYEQGRLTAALQLLATVDARQPFLYFGAKTLQLKAFYELGEWDALDSLLESLRVYLQRHPDLGYHREHYLLLAQFARRLLQLAPTDREGKTALRKEVEAAITFREREWFLRQLE
ncbi:MAG: hypothetical protein KDD10_17795 [Phaeodactylibacter sp.]|nr:hypothetical protein [Phaeodactylibacter sp.]MCB9292275.1 hypothetical protein [Lewinellaceae bacterium]